MGLSVLAVHKFYNDSYMTNNSIFKALDLDYQEWNQLERDFLTILDYRILITDAQFQECLTGVESFFHPVNRQVICDAERVIES